MKRAAPKPDVFPLKGFRINLRLVQTRDAAFIHGLRCDTELSEHLSPISGTIDDQATWIEGYKTREDAGEEYYFVVENKAGASCGLVRLYDITPPEFTWGSIILGSNKPRKAALETMFLSLKFGFHVLDCSRAQLDVRRGNERAISLYRRFGMRETGGNKIDLYFEMDRDTFVAQTDRYVAAIREDSTP